ncbi:ABC transporter substrate-binding protein [Pseudomonas sp. NPDC096917]|uniref:ABC transporter substrate-binding protein n=1 Tax=Pseudomonas sp. NPDC096917 TaxID=3364483 RepID=UPI00383A4706
MRISLLSSAVAAALFLVSAGAFADVAAIKNKGEIVIGTLGTDEPNSFIDAKTRQIIGYEIDLGNEVAKDLGVKPVYKQISVAARIPELQQGRVDLLAASLTHNKERESLVDFSSSILITGQKALVKKSSGITSLDQLAGKKVLTVKGGTQEPNIRKAIPTAQVVTFETSQQALLALQQGKGQAFVDDESALTNDFAKIGAASAGYSILPENLSTEALALALPKDSGDLKVAVDKTLARLESSGEAEKLYLKWYGPGTKSNQPERHFKIDSDQVE